MAAVPPPANRLAFEGLFPKLVDDVSDHLKQYNLPQNALEWLRIVCNPWISRSSLKCPPLNLQAPTSHICFNVSQAELM